MVKRKSVSILFCHTTYEALQRQDPLPVMQYHIPEEQNSKVVTACQICVLRTQCNV